MSYYVTNENSFLDIKNAHLRVTGNVHTDVLKVGSIGFQPAGSNISGTVNFTNVTTGVTTTSNLDVGGTLNLGTIELSASTHTLDHITARGNVTSTTVQFDNAHTSLVTSGNVEVGGELTVSGGVVSNVNLLPVSNVASIKVDSNVVTEYTGPHDRPLREYPEIAMTTASGTSSGYKGYKVSTSSQLSGYEGYKAFDKTGWETPAVENNNAWVSGGSKYVVGTGLPDTGAFTTSYVGGTATGEYIQLQLPRKIKISKYDYTPRTHTGNDEGKGAPKTVKLLGSNDDGSTWTLIKDITHTGTRPEEGVFYTARVDATEYYDYIRFVATSTYTDGNSPTFTDVRLSQIRFYGHEKGSGSLDTTLKTVYNVPATTGTQLEVYYDGQDHTSGSTITDKVGNSNSTITSGTDITFDPTWKAWTFSSNTSRTQSFRSGTLPSSLTSSTSISAALWFKFGTTMGDRAIFHIAEPQANRDPNSPSTWANKILEIRGNVGQEYRFSLWDGEYTWRFNTPFFDQKSYDIPIGEWYHLAMSITDSSITGRKLYFNGVECDLVDGSRRTATSASELNLPSDAVLELGRRPGQGIGNTVHNASNEFDGSIANFRLYSKALNADQVKELYDYQKDYFLGSKSQLTLYKGHLGIGVTEPSGQLELAGDERIQEYPPRAFETSAGTIGPEDLYIEGHGHFKVWSTSYFDANYTAGGAFTKSNGHTYDSWISAAGNWETGTGSGNGSPTATAPTFAGYKGSHLILELPYSILLKSFIVDERDGLSYQLPAVFVIIASNDGINWDTIFNHTVTAGVASDYAGNIFSVNATKTYSQYGFVSLNNGWTSTDDHLAVGEWRLFGTPGPTTLDKGSLSLTRSLDVPRISRYDVDTETPRPEKLILNLDTTVNSTPIDISGKGNHGQFYGVATYSATDKAFTGFTSGTSNHIRGNLNGVSGAYAHTQSYWVNGADGTSRAAFTVGVETGNYSFANLYWDTTNGPGGRWVLNSDGAATATWVQPIEDDRWYHVVLTYDGGSSDTSWKFYLDGEYQTPTTMTGITPLALPSNPQYRVGRNNGTQWYNGIVSNIKVYSVALEPSEVKKLYNMGRTGRSTVISDTAVGIGKTPEANLDVRGTGIFQGLGVNTDNLIGALQVHQGPNISFGGQSDTIRDVVPGFVISSDSAKWAMFINTNDDLILTSHSSLSGTYTGVSGYILDGAHDQQMNDFTGQHRCFLRGIPREQIKDKVGLIVSSDKNKYTMISGDIVTGQNAIDISESIPDVSISQKAHDKACFGVISGVEDPEKREDLYGVFGTPFPKENGDDRVYINSVGEGAIWVANTNGSLEAGDYITTSNVAGYGQKQDSAGLMNYTVAKITMDCDFNPETQPIQKIKKKQEITRYWRSSSGEESTEEKDGFDELVEKVEIVNDLDEHGQIQWEDDPIETEKAYKVRYLTVDGTQTDEANAVHTAAFVGCTYHCG